MCVSPETGPLVRDPHHLRRPLKAEEHRIPDRNQGSVQPHSPGEETIRELIPASPAQTDLQMVNITLRVLCRPRVDSLAKIYTELGTNYDEVVLPSIVNEVLKSVVAQFNAS